MKETLKARYSKNAVSNSEELF